jgi:hypothetical protein
MHNTVYKSYNSIKFKRASYNIACTENRLWQNYIDYISGKIYNSGFNHILPILLRFKSLLANYLNH